MDVVVIAQYAGSRKHGMVYGHYYLAREWVRSGHRVTIIAGSFAHPRIQQPVVRGGVTEEVIDGIRYLWVPTPTYVPASRFGRIRNMLSFVLQAWWGRLPITKADVVVCSSHHPFAIHPARRIARRWGAQLIFEVRDLWPLTLIELGGASRRNPFIMAMQFSEDYAYRHADRVVSVLPGARPYMVARGMAAAKFRFIPNGVDPSEASSSAPLPTSHAEALARLRDRGAFLVGYAGRIGLANALETLLSALAQCPAPDICLVLLGNGPLESDLKAHADRLGLYDRIMFLDSVRKDQVPEFLRQIDVAYVGYAPQPLYQFGVSPTKLADYMLASRPVLSAMDAPDDIVATSGAGISCRAGDVRGIADAIAKFRTMSASERQEMGERGRRWLVAHRDYRLLAARFLSRVEEAYGGERRDPPS